MLGADSTSTLPLPNGVHFFNHGQKLFQIGTDSSLGIVTWGMGGLADKSHRTIIAVLADDLKLNPPANIEDATNRFSQLFWTEYQRSPFKADINKCNLLNKKKPYDANIAIPDPSYRTEQEEHDFKNIQENLTVGFCIAGYTQTDRVPEAFTVMFEPLLSAPPAPIKLQFGPQFWGAPIMILRLILGYDPRMKDAIQNSTQWAGTVGDLDNILGKFVLSHGPLPIRDAIDFIYTCIFSTIKAYKFSNMPQICGGPIELAVITTDRPFRWVRHKGWDSAISGGEC